MIIYETTARGSDVNVYRLHPRFFIIHFVLFREYK